jgi:dynein intermediate chain, cytosolic
MKDRVSYSKEIQTDRIELQPVEIKETNFDIAILPDSESPLEQHEPIPKDLTEEERLEMMISDSFIDFFEKSAKVMERALNEDYDFLKDYNADLMYLKTNK